jgi:tripartite-type tricarboxylate transporter receptor subunit TctC
VFFSSKGAKLFRRADHRGGDGSQVAQGRVARLCGQKGLPKEIAAQYETVIKKASDNGEFKAFVNRRGFDMIHLDSADFVEFMKAGNEDYGKALKSLGLAT